MNTRGKSIADALSNLSDAGKALAEVDLRSCNNQLRAHIKRAQDSIHEGTSQLEDALREHLRQENRKATS